MATLTHNRDDQPISLDMIPYAAGLIIGPTSWSSAVTLAKVLLYFFSDGAYEKWKLIQVAFVVILFFTLLAVLLGHYAERRSWINRRQIVGTVYTAIVTIILAIVDQALPNPDDGSHLSLGENIYYLGWVVAYLVIAPLQLPNDHSSVGQPKDGLHLMAVASIVAIASFAVGYILVSLAEPLYRWFSSVFQAESGEPLSSARRFWLASPPTLNALCGVTFLVTFLPIWWPEVWRSSRRTNAKRWWMITSLFFASVYAALFGSVFYASRDWAHAAKLDSHFGFGLAFAAFPLVLTVVVVVATRQACRFWWFLPPGLAMGFASIAFFLLVPPIQLTNPSPAHVGFLVTAHAVNGFLLGFVLANFEKLQRLVVRSI